MNWVSMIGIGWSLQASRPFLRVSVNWVGKGGRGGRWGHTVKLIRTARMIVNFATLSYHYLTHWYNTIWWQLINFPKASCPNQEATSILNKHACSRNEVIHSLLMCLLLLYRATSLSESLCCFYKLIFIIWIIDEYYFRWLVHEYNSIRLYIIKL